MTTSKRTPAAQAEYAKKAAAMVAVNGVRVLSKPEVCDRTGRAFVTLWEMMRKGTFPKARELGGRPVWIESEIDEFLAALPERTYKPWSPPTPRAPHHRKTA